MEVTSNNQGFGKGWLLIGILGLTVILFFVSKVDMPAHKEDFVPPLVPTLVGITAAEAITVPEGFSVREQQILAQEGFSIVDPNAPMILTFDDIPVSSGESFEVISVRVKDVVAAEEPDMLEWSWEQVAQADGMLELFNADGTPVEGNTTRWHGYFARWIMVFHRDWLPKTAQQTAPAVTYWTLYLQMRLHVPNEKAQGAAPWEWPQRYDWLD